MKRQHHHPFSSFFTCIVFDRSSEEKSNESKNYACVFTFIWIPKRKKRNRTHYLLIQYFFCVLVFWIFMSILKIIFQANRLQNVVPDNIFQIVAMDHFYSLLFWTIFCPILQIPFPDNIFGQTAVMDNIFANCRCEWVTCKFWRLSFKSSL